MPRYYVNSNAQRNGDHEVHREGCRWLPNTENRVYLGEYDTCRQAVIDAWRSYPQSNGCSHCSPDCHTG